MPSYTLKYHYEQGQPFAEPLESSDSIEASMEARRREARLRRLIVGVVGVTLSSSSGYPLLDTRGTSRSPRVPAGANLGLIPREMGEALCGYGHDAGEG